MHVCHALLIPSLIIPALYGHEAGPKITFKLVDFPPAYTAKLHLKAIHEVADVRIMQENGRTSPTEADLASSQIANSEFLTDLQQGVRDLAIYTPIFKKPIPSTKAPYLSILKFIGTVSIVRNNRTINSLPFLLPIIYKDQSESSFSITFKKETTNGIIYSIIRDEDENASSAASRFTGQIQQTSPR